MKTRILTICLVLLACAGCGEEFGAGFGTGVAVSVDRFNKEIVRYSDNLSNLSKASDEMETVIKAHPTAIANMIEPGLGDRIDEAVVNLKNLADKAEEFKDKEGDFDWWKIGSALAILLTGGTAVNITKNRIAKKNG